MEFYQILQSILDEKGLSIPEAARLSDLADSTVRTILSRKSKSVSLEVAFKLSNGLGVSIERLNGEPQREVSDSAQVRHFTEREVSVILAYRRASDDDKTIVDAALRKYMTSNSIKGDSEKMA